MLKIALFTGFTLLALGVFSPSVSAQSPVEEFLEKLPSNSEQQTQTQTDSKKITISLPGNEMPAKIQLDTLTFTLPASKVSSSQLVGSPPNGNWCYLVNSYDSWSPEIAFGVCMAESHGQPLLVNNDDYHNWGSSPCRGSIGLMQIACAHVPFLSSVTTVGDLYDPYLNMQAANELYLRAGSFDPWSAYTRGGYRLYTSQY